MADLRASGDYADFVRAGRVVVLAVVAAALLTLSGSALAATAPLGLAGCGVSLGAYQCSGLVSTWDGIPLDATVTLPRSGTMHAPLVVELNGFGNSKWEYLDPSSHAYTGNAYDWARRGY